MGRRREPVPIAVVAVLGEWWVEGEGVLAAQDAVDHRPDAVRGRYTDRTLRTRGRPDALPHLPAFVDWAASYAARDLVRRLRDGLRFGRLTADDVPGRAARELAAALVPPVPQRRFGRRPERFDPDAHLDTVVERGRAGLHDGLSSS